MPFAGYFLALAITLAVELPIVGALVRSRVERGWWIPVLLLNLFTHPLANLAHWEGLAPFVVIEATVVLVEAGGFAFLLRLGPGRALLVSLAANTVTAAGSLLFL